MITLITGLPGNGKTLFALWYVKKYAEAENREVFYSGIKDLLLPWTEFKSEDWMTLPAGSIIVIDEAQFVFPRKPNGSKLPDFYEQLATHRHHGFDIFMITQDPGLVDSFPRKLTGRHFHCVRKFGMSRSTIYEWSAVNMTPQQISTYKSAIPMKWAFPKEVYGYYKSAEVHTVKRSIPLKLVLASLFIVGVLAAGYYALERFKGRGQRMREEAGLVSPGAGASSGLATGELGKAAFNSVEDAKRFVQLNTPRVVGLPQTAPKYDELTKPTRVPVPAMCIARQSGCQCYTQQATRMDVKYNMCLDIAHNGYFQDFDPERDQHQGERIAEASRIVDAQEGRLQPSQARESRSQAIGSQVAVLGGRPDGNVGIPNGNYLNRDLK